MKTSKIILFMLVALLALSPLTSLAASSEQSRIDNLNPIGTFPIVKEPVTVKIWVVYNDYQPDYANTYVWTEYEKMTNVIVEWEPVHYTQINERLSLLLSSNEPLPDAFYRCQMNAATVATYGADGYFLRLNELIDTYMPNFKEVAERNHVLGSLASPNGDIYALSSISESPEINIHPKLFLNTRWMQNVGITEMPKTIEDLIILLDAFVNKDGNGNGVIGDELGLTTNSAMTLLRTFTGAYGLNNRGTTQITVDADPETGDMRFVYTTDQFREVLELLADMFARGLIDNDMFGSGRNPKLVAAGANDMIGALTYVNTGAFLPVERLDEFVGLTEALEGPYGDKIWASKPEALYGPPSALVLSDTCSQPEVLAMWADFFYTEAGSLFFHYGKEGETFFFNEENKPEFMPEILESDGSTNLDTLLSKVTPYSGGGNVVLITSNTASGGEMLSNAPKAAHDMVPYTPELVWGTFRLTPDEQERYNIIYTEMINNNFNVMVPKFISGEVEINDDTWAQFVKGFEDAGLAEYLEIMNAALDRWEAANGL